jgi:hypothetical protein
MAGHDHQEATRQTMGRRSGHSSDLQMLREASEEAAGREA